MEQVDRPIQHFLVVEVPSLLQVMTGGISIPVRRIPQGFLSTNKAEVEEVE
jgi:hypothetical protein